MGHRHRLHSMIPILLLLSMCPVVLMHETPRERSGIDDFGKPRLALSSKPPSVSDVSPTCLQDLLSLLSNTGTLIPVLDSFGKPTPGMLVGNLAWLGHFDECMGIAGYHYCSVNLGVNLTMAINTSLTLPIQWGVCVPESCSEGDVRNSLELLLEYLNVSWITLENIYGSASNCIDKPNTDFNGGFIATCVLLGFLFLLSVCGSLLDHYLHCNSETQTGKSLLSNTKHADHRTHANLHAHQNHYTSLEGTDAEMPEGTQNECEVPASAPSSEKTPLLVASTTTSSSSSTSGPSPGGSAAAKTDREPSAWMRFLLGFAITRNLPKILSAKQAEGGIPCLNGIRVISMSWVILGHTLVMVASAGLNENIGTIWPKWINSFAFQAIGNALFSVDSFFFLSGLLLTYLTLKKLKETGGKLSWGWFYLHRYLRLTPALAMLILVYMYILPNMSQGPVWYITDVAVSMCRSWWWTDLLYINNFVPPALVQDCIPWAWYLANDMQFFLISPLIIIPLFWYPVIGLAAIGVLCVVSFITSSVLVHQYDFFPGILQAGAQAAAMIPDTDSRYLPANTYSDVIYNKPYCRIPPYLVGMALGYVVYRIGSRKIKMSPVIAAAGWAVASALGIAVVYGLYDANRGASVPTQAASMAYTSLSTFTWGVALSWVVFACHYGYGGVINDFLSWSFWIPLSRLTYSSYLLHPVVMQLYAFSLAVPIHWSALTLAYNFVGFLVLAYACSLLMNVLVEFPFGNMEKMVQKALQKPQGLEKGHQAGMPNN